MVKIADDMFAVRGDMVFASVTNLLRESDVIWRGANSGAGGTDAVRVQINLQDVGEADSAGLALLLEWYRRAMRSGCTLRFTEVPRALQVLATVSGAHEILMGDEGEEGNEGDGHSDVRPRMRASPDATHGASHGATI